MTESSAAYVRRAISLYRDLAGGAARPRHSDRQLAEEFQQQGISLALLECALRLAAARRDSRPRTAPPLESIRSLHYVVPIIEELRRSPKMAQYAEYLRRRSGDETRPMSRFLRF